MMEKRKGDFMKLAFISDIHGNAIALDAVLEDIQNKGVEETIVLGDIAYRGPEPKRSIELVRKHSTQIIKGNADEWVVRGVEKGEVPDKALALMQKEADWTKNQLSEEDINFLNDLDTELIIKAGNKKIHAFHATPNSLFDVVNPNDSNEKLLAELTQKEKADVYLYGHIHQAYSRVIIGKRIINLGSVGLPFDGIPEASYVLVEVSNNSLQTSHVRVPYSIEKAIQMYDEVDYPNKEMMKEIVRNGEIS